MRRGHHRHQRRLARRRRSSSQSGKYAPSRRIVGFTLSGHRDAAAASGPGHGRYRADGQVPGVIMHTDQGAASSDLSQLSH
jgi:hypothetical protein